MFGLFEKTETVRLSVEGMSCCHCVARVKDALLAVSGVKKAEVDLEGKSAAVTFVPAKVTPEALVQAVTAAGYGVRVND